MKGTECSSVLDRIYGLTSSGIKLGLDNIKKAAAILDLDLSAIRFAHIAGTNGKGSTSAMLYSLIKNHSGESCAVYTSPHLIRFNERIVVDGEEISDYEIVKISEHIFKKCGKLPLTFFEVTTLMAFLHFSEKKAKNAVIEVGLGGRLDATNVIDPCVSVITGISMDHIEYLGSSLDDISKEKAGIIKENRPVVLGPGADNPVIRGIARDKKAKTVWACKKEISLDISPDRSFSVTLPDGTVYKDLQKKLYGDHQYYNACCAIAAFHLMGFSGSSVSVSSALQSAHIKGRIEKFTFKGKNFYIDVSHNPEGVQALVDFVNSEHPGEKLFVALGMLKDKDIGAVISILRGRAEKVLLVPTLELEKKRGSSKEDYINAMGGDTERIIFCGDFKEAVDIMSEQEGVRAITGSLYNYKTISRL